MEGIVEFILAYLDDMLTSTKGSSIPQDNLEKFAGEVLKCLQAAELQVNLAKS
jgi:hypothetical protein